MSPRERLIAISLEIEDIHEEVCRVVKIPSMHQHVNKDCVILGLSNNIDRENVRTQSIALELNFGQLFNFSDDDFKGEKMYRI